MPISRSLLKRDNNNQVPQLEVKIRCDFVSSHQSVYISLYKITNRRTLNKKRIGVLRLDHIRGNTWETHFPGSIPMSERNKGYGIYMYSLAADLASFNQWTLRSSNLRSISANRCWRSNRLRKYYDVKKRRGFYYIKPKKTINLMAG